MSDLALNMHRSIVYTILAPEINLIELSHQSGPNQERTTFTSKASERGEGVCHGAAFCPHPKNPSTSFFHGNSDAFKKSKHLII